MSFLNDYKKLNEDLNEFSGGLPNQKNGKKRFNQRNIKFLGFM